MRLIRALVICTALTAAQFDPEEDAAEIAAINADRIQKVMREHTGAEGVFA